MIHASVCRCAITGREHWNEHILFLPFSLENEWSILHPLHACYMSFMCWPLSLPFLFLFWPKLSQFPFLPPVFVLHVSVAEVLNFLFFLVPSGSCTACLCWLRPACSSALLLFRGTDRAGGGAPVPLSTPTTMIKNLGPLAHGLPHQTKEKRPSPPTAVQHLD